MRRTKEIVQADFREAKEAIDNATPNDAYAG